MINYPDLKSHFDNKDKAWWHYINVGKKQEFTYFRVQDNFKKIFFKKQTLLYYVGTTCYQDFNTGIQRVTRNLSNIIGNYFKEYKLFLVTYDNIKDDLRLLNDTELNVFCKYNGYNNNNNNEKIKVSKNTTLFIPELFHINQYEILRKIIEKSNKKKYQIVTIYHDDSIYNNTELPESFRQQSFDTYMKIVSKIDIIIPNSNYSKYTYLFHKERLRITSKQEVKAIPLSGELLNSKRIISKNFVDNNNYIFSNISITKRKNVDNLIKAFNLLNNDFPNIKLIICGTVYEKNDYYNTFKNKLTKNIIFEENKKDEEIIELYKNALFSVYPSIEEGFGLPIYESLWNCTPVICHNATSTYEIANEINSECVISLDCLNHNSLYLQMKKWMKVKHLKKICSQIKNIRIKTWYEYTDEIMYTIKKREEIFNKSVTIYYYIHHTSSNNIRTGIQNYSIYLAKQFVKKNIPVIFVKWDENLSALVPCNHLEIDHFFNYNETDDIMEEIHYDTNNFKAIHLTNTKINKSIFFNPEYTYSNFANNINNYLSKHSIISIHVLHDIIPLVLDCYSSEKINFNPYFKNNILTSDKIITVSNFSKVEFYDYCKKHIPHLENCLPIVKSILLPYQYRNKKRTINTKIEKKISILLPGSIEYRKQQLLFIKLFNKFITLNPNIDVELISFGHIHIKIKDEFDAEIKKSNNKIKHLGIIDNNKLFELYKKTSFTCYISYYEGFGLPISESLWHGTPVLTSNFGSMYEVAKKGGCYCIDSRNENEIYEALEKLIVSPDLLDKLKKEIECANFTTWKSYADEVYNELVNM